jgi:histidine triad (HIT) family protein
MGAEPVTAEQSTCIFCRIVRGEIPAQVVARDDRAVAFLDNTPLADGHVLVVPSAHVSRLEGLPEQDASALFRLVVSLCGPVRRALGGVGTTVGINDGEATGQTVPHVHVHIVPRHHGDGAGSIHSIFPRRGRRDLAEVGQAIRDHLAKQPG